MEQFSQAEIEAYYRVRVPRLNQRGSEWRGPCPVHRGKDLNFAVNPETGAAYCHSQCDQGWDIIGLEQALMGSRFTEAKRDVYDLLGRSLSLLEDHEPRRERQKSGTFECAYDYTDENGTLLYQSVRYKNPKGFKQRRPDGNGGWIWGVKDTAKVPYHLPEVIKADFVFIVEGEKDADSLSALGVTATCNNEGAGKFRPELVPWFAGKRVAILPDNDEPGWSHAQDVAAKLHGTAKSVKIVELPDLPEKGDVSDYLWAGGTKDSLRELYLKAPYFSPETVPHEEDKYIRSLSDEIEIAGGFEAFWDMRLHAGVATPFDPLTRALGGGMLPGEVYAIAARTGHGKTSLGLQFAIKASRAGLGVLIFSMEMTSQAVFRRLVSIEARVDLNEFRYLQARGEDTPEMRNALHRYTVEFASAPIWVSMKSRVSPKYLVDEAGRQKDVLPKLDLIIVDHMQLMGPDEKTASEYEKFTSISRALKQSAKELNLPVLVMAQVHRKDEYGELSMDDIRGSGAIEEDSAGVMLIYEDPDDAKQAKITGRYQKGPVKTWLKLDKSRFGSSGEYLPLMHTKAYTRFDLEGRED